MFINYYYFQVITVATRFHPPRIPTTASAGSFVVSGKNLKTWILDPDVERRTPSAAARCAARCAQTRILQESSRMKSIQKSGEIKKKL
jgi:hypothetical protein